MRGGCRLPLTIDWEDWFQLCTAPFDGADAYERYECRLPEATELTLALCADLGATATWFCLADQARRHPELLRRVAAGGHRIALHGLTHRRAFEMTREEFRASLQDGKAILEDLSGQAVEGFRAPEWSLRGEARRYWDLLPGLGFRYDSSRAPLAVLGSPEWPQHPYRLITPGGPLWEVPPPVIRGPKFRLPLWGWALRTLPELVLRQRLKKLGRRDAGNPVVLHPWELDEGQPDLPQASFGHRFAHGAGLRGYGARLRRLLRGFRLVPVEQWLTDREAAERAAAGSPIEA